MCTFFETVILTDTRNDRLDPLLLRAGRPLVNAADQLHLRVRQTVVESLSAG